MDDSIDEYDSEECVPQENLPDDDIDDLPGHSAPPQASGYQRVEVIEEIQRWDALEVAYLHTELREVIARRRRTMPEVLVHLSRNAYKSGDRKTLNLAFEALAKTTVRLLLSQAWGTTDGERHEQTQEVLMKIFEAIRNDKADFAETNFNAFAKCRAIELYRARRRTMEGSNTAIEPLDDADPVDDLRSNAPRHDYQALLAHALGKLPPNHRAAFIQYHRFGMTQEEIAMHHQVTVRTVFSWLRKAEAAVGLSGDENER